MTNPKYKVNERVFLKESAKLGWIEAYEVVEVRMVPDGQWCYRFRVPEKAPQNTTVGDINNLKQTINWEVSEDELIEYCDALTEAISYLDRRLTELRQLQQYCEDTDGTG